MKKVLSTIAILATATAAFAQGYVNFNAGSIPYADTVTSGGVTNVTPTAANGFYYALLVKGMTSYNIPSADTTVWDGTWTFTGLMSSNSTVTAGRVLGLGSSLAVGSIVNNLGQAWNGNGTSTGGPDGTTNSIVLVGWSANLGASWSVVAAELLAGTAPASGFFGESMIGDLVPNYSTPGAAIFGTTVNGVNGTLINNPAGNPILLYQVPEPGTMALAGLGGLALLLIRRRK